MAKSPDPHSDEPYYGSAAPLVPASEDLDVVREAAAACRACHLWKFGTQTVFGEGPPKARIMLIGEQPGDKEDLEGHAFVGPAGRVLNEALEEAGIDREDVYLTNAVKHFKWIPKGPRRLHQKPNRREIVACKPWLDAEIARVRPVAIVLMGATAAQALLGSSFRLTQHRGEFVASDAAERVLATIHPSAILRAPTHEGRVEAKEGMIRDLRMVANRIS